MKTSAVLLTTLVTFTLVQLSLAGRKGNRNQNGGCRYRRVPWGECDEASNTQTKTMVLKSNQEPSCEETKNVTRPCKTTCQYKRAEWSECTDGQKTMTMTLKRSSPLECESTKLKNKPCKEVRNRQKRRQRKKSRQTKIHARRNNQVFRCLFVTSNISDCDPVTNMTLMTLTLKKGDAAVCGQTKIVSRPCGGQDSDCKYSRATAGECVDGSRTITKNLEDGDPDVCQQTINKQKPCGERRRAGRRNKNKNKGGDDSE